MKTIISLLLALFVVGTANAVTYEYDEAGRLVKVVHDNGMQTLYTYDLNGNLVRRSTDVVNSVDESDAASTITVAPQPGRDVVTITLNSWEGASAEVTLFNSEGAIVLRLTKLVEDHQLALDVRQLPSGTYQASIVSGKVSVSTPVSVVR